jgi:hypothetical protein
MNSRPGPYTGSRTGTDKEQELMKKTYSRPDIWFEDFSLSTNIAAGCEATPFDHSEGCGVKINRVDILFSDSFGDTCNVKIIDGDPNYNGLCYHNPTMDRNVFFS